MADVCVCLYSCVYVCMYSCMYVCMYSCAYVCIGQDIGRGTSATVGGVCVCVYVCGGSYKHGVYVSCRDESLLYYVIYIYDITHIYIYNI